MKYRKKLDNFLTCLENFIKVDMKNSSGLYGVF